jgi:hypothetical protein
MKCYTEPHWDELFGTTFATENGREVRKLEW